MAVRKGFRSKEEVQPVLLRMGRDFVNALDDLCDVNGRSRREIVEMLVDKAWLAWDKDENERINP